MSDNCCSHGAVSPRISHFGAPRHSEAATVAVVKSNLANARLYGILDLGYAEPCDAARIVEQMIEGGVDVIQLRGKGNSVEKLIDVAVELHELTTKSSTPLIVNDYAEIASRVPVEGVHVGQDDDSIDLARRKAGRAVLFGKSTHTVEQARAAEREGADYVGFGPIFATPTKPQYLPVGLADIRRVHAEVSLPIFCIGGINIDNLQSVIDAGAKRVVMVSALLRAHSIVDYARCATDMLA